MAPPVLASLAEDPACDGSWRSCEAVMAGDRSRDVALQAQDVVVVPASGAKVATLLGELSEGAVEAPSDAHVRARR